MMFFDTYALYESINGSAAYARLKNEKIITNLLNRGELYNALLRDYDRETADSIMHGLAVDMVNIDLDIVMQAIRLKRLHARKRLSMVDCIGYALARKHGMKFLTGDRQFEGMEGVEFVR